MATEDVGVPTTARAADIWSTAVPDWEQRIMEGRTPIPDLPLFETSADKAVQIFSRLRMPDLIGTPTFGEVCEPWVFDFVRALFGAYDPETRERKISEAFLLIPKKNSKSTVAAAIMVTAAILNERPNAQALLIAPTQEIAQIAFKTASDIIGLDDDLAALFRRQAHLKLITHQVTGCTIKVVSADGDVITGSKAAYVLIDETHVLAAKQKAADLFIELRGGLASRPEGFLLQITTQSKSPPQGQWRKELERARAVRDGTSTSRVLAVLYELPKHMLEAGAWRDEQTWGLVNPNLERSVSLDFLREQYADAAASGPEALALFASQHLNVQIGIGLHSDRWAGTDLWAGAGDPSLSLEAIMDRAEVCTVGVDGGGLDDLLGVAVIGRERGSRRWLVWAHAWAHPIVAERRKEIAPRLRDLAQAGDLTWCETPTEDIEAVGALIERLHDAGLLPGQNGIGLDPWGVAQIVDRIAETPVPEDAVVGVKQGVALTAAIQTVERKLADGTLAHCNQALMDWCVGNAKVETRGSAVTITKEVAGRSKIDPLIAAFNAGMLMARNPQPCAPIRVPEDYRVVA